MSLGGFLFRSLFAKPAKHGVNKAVNSAVTAAVVAGAATAASVAVTKIIENKQRNAIPSHPQANSVPARDPYVDAMLGKAALCYYVAKADGYISQDEQLEIDGIISEFMSNTNVPARAKEEITRIMNTDTISFGLAEKYLNKVEPSVLISLARDVEKIAEASEGILPAEEKAIGVFKSYVTSKTGYTFEKKAQDKKVTEVSLTCDCCNGTMELDATYLKAVCPYCGAAKIIDASQISAVVAEQERTKRMKGNQ